MANENRHGNKKATKRTPYTGFENAPKRDAKGHFVKLDNGQHDKKKANDGYNCYKNAKPSMANSESVQQIDTNLYGVSEILDYINKICADLVESIGYDYEKKPVYSRAEMDRVVSKTRHEVYESVRKHFKMAFRNGVIAGASAVIAVGLPVCVFWPNIVNFAKSLFA